MNVLYDFVYRGVLTEESLDKSGRKNKAGFSGANAEEIRKALSFDLMDGVRIAQAQRMATIYTGIHAFENSVRHFVATGMAEAFEEEWWSKVPTKIQGKVKTRMEDEAKFRWHGARGGGGD